MKPGNRLSWIVLLLSTAFVWSQPLESKSSPPFELTPEEEKSVDRALQRWEQWNSQVKTFRCRFKRWTYNAVFQTPRPNQSLQPKYIESGVIKFAAPDRGLFRVKTTEKDGKETPINDSRAEHWIFDGKSIFEYNSFRKQVIEYKLPPDIQINRLVDGPLSFGFATSIFHKLFSNKPPAPFPFGAKAEELKQRYFIRIITPHDAKDQIWLEAYPRGSSENSSKLQLIFTARNMSPFALRIVDPNGRDYMVYQFLNVVVDGPPSATDDNPFRPAVPPGWQRIGNEPPLAKSKIP